MYGGIKNLAGHEKVYLWEVGRISWEVEQMDIMAKVDEKGRVLIPSNIRKQLNIKNAVKIIVESGEIVLKPVEDPLKRLEKLVVKGTTDVEEEIHRLRRVAENELRREA
ncbi:MAG: AbrB/MazE/SpoVT family DNA-binding domain-containing protein [Candidatus Bathyarchaeia archaeon]